MNLTSGGNLPSSEVLDLIRQGKKIAAIKLYREQTGAGLKEAKNAVDAYADGSAYTDADNNPSHSTQASPEVLELIRQGRKIDAVKLYREQSGGGLKEAKDAVDILVKRHKQDG